MENRKIVFSKFVEQVESLKISNKEKQHLIDNVCDILFELEDIFNKDMLELRQKITKLEAYILQDENMQNEEFEIKCPYCNEEVTVFMDKKIMDMMCPACNNIIEIERTSSQECNKKCNGGCCGK